MAGSQLLVRFDSGSTQAIDSKTEQALIEQLINSFADCDALIVSDYGYGILHRASNSRDRFSAT
jgi:D-beta-D-heptose 7-phosphate kinase/D-beta-D-heptose 1-phosphate adenosyltransferase